MFFPDECRARGAWSAAALCLALALPAAARAAPVEMTLHEAVRRAVERAPLLDARAAQLEAARERVLAAGALPPPMLMAGVDSLPVTGDAAFDARAEGMTMKRIGFRQELPARAKREAQRSVAERRSEEAVADVQAGRLGVRQETANGWIELWAAQRAQAALHALRGQAVLAARLAKARVGGGSATVADALAAQAAVVELDERLEAARTREEAARAELARWLGEEEVHVPEAAPGFDELPVAEAQLLDSVDRTIPLLPATARVETAAAQVDAARAERRSDWSVAASYGQRAGDRSDMLMLEFGIGLPVFTRHRRYRDVAASEADYQAAVSLREDLRREQAARLRAGIARWHGLRRQADLYDTALLPLARDRSAAALEAYRAGGALQPWLEARRDELDAHLAHARRLAELGRAWAALAYVLPHAEVQP